MKVRLEPVTAIVLAIVLGWGWGEMMNKPICQVEEVHDGKVVLVPRYCEDILEQ